MCKYCWWKNSCTAWDVQNLVNNGITYLSTGLPDVWTINSISMNIHTTDSGGQSKKPPTFGSCHLISLYVNSVYWRSSLLISTLHARSSIRRPTTKSPLFWTVSHRLLAIGLGTHGRKHAIWGEVWLACERARGRPHEACCAETYLENLQRTRFVMSKNSSSNVNDLGRQQDFDITAHPQSKKLLILCCWDFGHNLFC